MCMGHILIKPTCGLQMYVFVPAWQADARLGSLSAEAERAARACSRHQVLKLRCSLGEWRGKLPGAAAAMCVRSGTRI